MAEPYLWGLLAVNMLWLAINVWHTRENWRKADENTERARENLRHAEETGALLRRLRDGVTGQGYQTGEPSGSCGWHPIVCPGNGGRTQQQGERSWMKYGS